MGHSGIYILIHFYDSTAKYIWSIGNKINDGHKAVAVLTLNNLLFDARFLLSHDATSIPATARAQSWGVRRKWQPLSSWHHEPHGFVLRVFNWNSFHVFCFRHRRCQKSHPMWPCEWNHVSFWVMEEDILCCPSSLFPRSFCYVLLCTRSHRFCLWLMSADGWQIKNVARNVVALTSNSCGDLWVAVWEQAAVNLQLHHLLYTR